MKSHGTSQARLGAALVFLSSVCCAAAPAPAAAPPPPAPAAAFDSGEAEVQKVYAGRKAYQEKDYAQAVPLLEAGARSVPGQPDVVLDLARAYAHSGDKEKALAQLDHLATIGFGDRVANAEAFASLRDDPRFQAVVKKIAAACAPVGKSRAGFAFSDAELIPGGMAYDPAQRLLYVGSFAKNKILAVTLDGKARDFTTSGQDGLGNVLSLHVDTKRNELLATSAAMGADGKGTGLFRYDLKTGHLLGKVMYESRGLEGEQLNDAIPTPSGDILVSEAASGNLFRLKKGGAKLEPILADKTFVYPNVLLLAPDGRHLYVA
ncbi:MAG TPA: tetratricopeptide repeat protein, partial [Thermoanaerobaculia bacterium]